MPRGDIWIYYFVLVLGMFVAQTLGHLVSICIDSSKAQLVGVVCVLILNMLNGYNPTISIMNQHTVSQFASIISYSRWQQEMLWNKELNTYVLYHTCIPIHTYIYIHVLI